MKSAKQLKFKKMSKTLNAIGMVAGPLASALGGRIMDQRNMANQRELQDRQYSYQRLLNQQGHDLQMDMWNKTNYGAQVEHMKAAGINPALLYGQSGGGGTTAGSQGGGSATGMSSHPNRMMDLQSAMLSNQIQNLKAQTENVEADTDKKKGETELVWAEQYIKSIEGSMTLDTLTANVNKLHAEAEKLKQDYDLTQDNYDNILAEMEAKALERFKNIELMDKKLDLTDAQIKQIDEVIDQTWYGKYTDRYNAITNQENAKTNRENSKTNRGNLTINEFKAELEKKFKTLQLDLDTKNMLIGNLVKLFGLMKP